MSYTSQQLATIEAAKSMFDYYFEAGLFDLALNEADELAARGYEKEAYQLRSHVKNVTDFLYERT